MAEENEAREPEVEAPEEPAAPAGDVGPDPIWGVCLGVFGLINMALGGAFTHHWWFNVGEAFLLLGAGVFLVCVALTAVAQQPLDLLKRLEDWRNKE